MLSNACEICLCRSRQLRVTCGLSVACTQMAFALADFLSSNRCI
jgi:hypothetical protein